VNEVRIGAVSRDDRAFREPDRISRFALEGRSRGLVDGCPPGLAKKYNGCMPPGLAKERTGLRSVLSRPAWWGLGGLAAGQYFYDDGYLVRYGDDGISGWLPLLGGALAPGRPWPGDYEPVALPDYYADYYELGPDYRYHDDVLYRLDPETSTISSIAALLTGDRWTVGEPLPLGYDVYNLPYDYRDQYVDGPEAWYRYNDGHIYEIDPETRLVSAVIELLT
jgi:hypothetical protein